MFRLAYNTNGLAHHRLKEAIVLLADLGYEGVAITPDVGELDPLDLRPAFVREVRALIGDLGLDVAIETGARFVLDPRRKHHPSLLEEASADRERRIDFCRRSIDLARELGAEVVSIWSGVAPNGERAGASEVGRRRTEPLWDSQLLPQIYVRRVLEVLPGLGPHAEDAGLLLVGRGHAQVGESAIRRYTEESSFLRRVTCW